MQHKGVTAEHGHRCDYISIGTTIRAISSLDEDINLCLLTFETPDTPQSKEASRVYDGRSPRHHSFAAAVQYPR